MKQHKTIFFQKNKRYNNNSATFEICPANCKWPQTLLDYRQFG